MVAASTPEAAAAGAEILRRGGNATDAAVAVAFALSVTDISQTGLGGGGVLIAYDARARRAQHLQFYPRTGADARWADTLSEGAQAPAGRAAGVPGMVAGLLEAHARFGRLPREAVMAPAIRLASDGFVVTPLLSRTISSARRRLESDPAATALLLPDGEPLRPGDRLVQPMLASTLSAIASNGPTAFYSGGVAVRLAEKAQAAGGLIAAADLAEYRVTDVPPLCGEWRGLTVLAPPPPMGGAPLLAMLQLAEAMGVTASAGLSSAPEAVAGLTDAIRAVQSDARWWRGDPDVMSVPALGFASAAYARDRMRVAAGPVADTMAIGDPWPYETTQAAGSCAAYPRAAAVRGTSDLPGSGESADATSLTSHLAVVDAEGNAVSATTTVGVLFGSGVYTDGFFLNSSAGNLDDRTRGPRRVANSTIAPALLLDGPRVRLVIGAAGSQYIQPAITQVALRVLAFGEDPFRAISAPRVQPNHLRRDVEVEPGFDPEVYAALVARGYRPLSRTADIQFGGVHAILVRPDGRRIGVADPRRDGIAVRQ